MANADATPLGLDSTPGDTVDTTTRPSEHAQRPLDSMVKSRVRAYRSVVLVLPRGDRRAMIVIPSFARDRLV